MADEIDGPDKAAWPHGPIGNPVDRYLHLPEFTRRFLEQLREEEVSGLNDFARMSEWKRQWFANLSQRNLEQIFPSSQTELDEWESNRNFVNNMRAMKGAVGRLFATAFVSAITLAVLGAIWLGIQTNLGKH